VIALVRKVDSHHEIQIKCRTSRFSTVPGCPEQSPSRSSHSRCERSHWTIA